MDAPYCKIEIVEVDVGFHVKQYAWIVIPSLVALFMVFFGSRWIWEAILT